MERNWNAGQASGLAKMIEHSRNRARNAQEAPEAERGRAGRPKGRRLVHEALHAALMGFAKA